MSPTFTDYATSGNDSLVSSRALELQREGYFCKQDSDLMNGASVNSLSLDIHNNSQSATSSHNSGGNTSGSAVTTMHTTATTNTPATNVNSFLSPDFENCSFESPEQRDNAAVALGSQPNGQLPLSETIAGGTTLSLDHQQHQQQQNSAVEQTLSNASSGTTSSGVKNYEYYKASKVPNGSGGNGPGHRISHTHTLSTPTAMSDFIAMLDAQSAIQQQWKTSGVGDTVMDENMVLGQSSFNYESNSDLSSNDFVSGAAPKPQEDSGSMSPLRNNSAQFIDPNLLKGNMFMDSFGLGPTTEYDVFQKSNLNPSLDDYMPTDLLTDSKKLAQMHSNRDSNLFSNDRRHSEVITQAVPEYAGARGSISHSIDFWNLSDKGTAVDSSVDHRTEVGDSKPAQSSFSTDNDVTQVLNDYNMSFTRTSRRGSHSTNPTSQRHGVKKQPRGSMSLLEGSLNNDLFSKLYKNGSNPANVKVVSWENSVFSDEDDDFNRRSFDSGMPNLEPIISPQSPKSGVVSKPNNQQFIKPSMMLSENASTAAKMATTGTEKIDLISNLDNWNYEITVDPTTKIRRSPPPHYQTIKPSPIATINSSMSAPAASRRRRSTPNIMTIRNGSSGNGAGGRGKSRSITPMSGTDEEAKPFKCKECSKAFRRSEHLKRHIRSVHSTERPFACMFCEKKFSRSDNLSQHLKTHKKHGDF